MRQIRYSTTIIAYFILSTVGSPFVYLVSSPILVGMDLLISLMHLSGSQIIEMYLLIVVPLPLLSCGLIYFTKSPRNKQHITSLVITSLCFIGLATCATILYAQNFDMVDIGPSGLYIFRWLIPVWFASFFIGLATLTALRAVQQPESDEKRKTPLM